MRIGAHDPEIITRIGKLATLWPHVEDAMVEVLSELIGPYNLDAGRVIFWAIVNQQARLAVMRDLLENTDRNRERTELFDEILDEFSDLNSIRNTYLHSKWVTFEDGRVYLAEAVASPFAQRRGRRVTTKELDAFTRRMEALISRVAIQMRAELRRSARQT